MGEGNQTQTLTDVLVMLARLEGKLDAMAAEHSTRLSNTESDVAQLDARLRTAASIEEVKALDARLSTVERKVWAAAGGLALVAAVASTVVSRFLP